MPNDPTGSPNEPVEEHHPNNPYLHNRYTRFMYTVAQACIGPFQQLLASTTHSTTATALESTSNSNTQQSNVSATSLLTTGTDLEVVDTTRPGPSINLIEGGSTVEPTTSLLSNSAWGDSIYHTKPRKACRIYFQNVYGLRSTNRIEEKWNDCLKVMSYYDVDIFGFVETTTNWSNRRLVQQYTSAATQVFAHAHINYSSNSYQTESNYLPGGSLQATVGNWTGRIKRLLHDPHKMGRWTGIQYSLRENRSLYVITAYRVVKDSQMGVISSFTQQLLALRKRFGPNTTKTPRMQIFLDLSDYIQSLSVHPQDYLLVMLDANETIGEDTYGVCQFMQRHNLVDIFVKHHNTECPIATYKRSHDRRIDYMVGTSNLMDYVQNCGYLPFDKGIHSDHRGLFLDLSHDMVSGNVQLKSPPIRKVGYTTCKSELYNYKQFILQEFNRHNIVERVDDLYTRSSPDLDDDLHFLQQLNDIDSEITRIVLSAETKTCTKKPGFPWSPAIHNASLLIKYWSIIYYSKNSKFDTSNQLKTIYDQLPNEYQINIDLTSSSNAKQNLKKAKQAKLQLYRTHKIQNLRQFEQRVRADAIHSGASPDTIHKRLHHKQKDTRLFKYLKTVYPKHRGKGITHIEVPVPSDDSEIDPDPSKATSWRTVYDPEEITNLLLQRNIKHFGQAANTPFATDHLQHIFGYTGTNQASIDLIQNGVIPSEIYGSNSSTGLHDILQCLSNKQNVPTFSDAISFDEFWKGFRVWDENTSTSPSNRHLGHYKCLLLSDGHDDEYNDERINPSQIIQQVYYKVAMAALQSGNTLHRWSRSSTMMLEKIPGQPLIHKLRVIHLYEADYNLLLKILWSRKLVWNSHKLGRLHDAQAGSRPNHRCSDVVIRKEMNYLYSRLTRTNLATIDNDAKACYDRIICNLAMLVSQYFGMSHRACRLHSKTLQQMRFTIRTASGDSHEYYQHTSDKPIHGSGQGSCASLSLWLHISSLLLQILASKAQGMIRHNVTQKEFDHLSAEGFVDDVALFVNNTELTEPDLVQLYSRIEHDIGLWQTLLVTSGGKLELTKCFYYILSWAFNKYGDPIPVNISKELLGQDIPTVNIKDPDTQSMVVIQQKPIESDHKTLGVLKNILGDEHGQFDLLMEKSNNLAIRTRLGQLTRFQARRAYTSIYMPAMLYSLVATSLSEQDLHRIQSKALQAFLPAMGYDSTFPRAILDGPRQFGGVNIGHLYTEMCIGKIGALISHIQGKTSLGRIMLFNLNWLQLMSGQSRPLLQHCDPLPYLETNWFLHLRSFLYNVQGSVLIPDLWLPKLERRGDKVIMDTVLDNIQLTNADRRIFNNWRIFFQASVLSDLVTPDGTRIQNVYWDSHNTATSQRRSVHNWPVQQQPDWSTFSIWKKVLKTSFSINNNGMLSRRLGDWTVPVSESRNVWSVYWDNLTKSLYKRQPDGSFWIFLDYEHTAVGNRYRYSTVPDNILDAPTAHSFPVETQEDIDITVTPGIILGTALQSDSSSSVTFDDYISRLPSWRGDLLLHWESSTIDVLQQTFQEHTSLLVASDGSFHSETSYGAFGAVIGTDEDIVMQVRGHAPGAGHIHSSHRSELYGLLSACVLLIEVTQFCKLPIQHGTSIQFYLDNKSVIDQVERHRKQSLHLGEYLASNNDVELQILAELQQLTNMGFRVLPLLHVKAHQDDHTPYSDLSRQAQLNVEADRLATTMADSTYFNIPYSTFPTTRAQLYINDLPITSKYKENLRTAYHSQDLRIYYCNKFEWTSDMIDSVWWDIHGSALQQLSHSERQQIQKFNIRRLHTNNRQKLYQESMTDKCMFCTDVVENNDHIIQCNNCSVERSDTREAWKVKLFDYLSEEHTPSDTRTAIITAITCWIHHQNVPRLSDIISNPSSLLQEAYASQTALGWDQFIRGKLCLGWHEIIHHHIRSSNLSFQRMTAEKWGTDLLLLLWRGVLSLWSIRNREKHGIDLPTSNHLLKTKLLQEASYWKEQGQGCHFTDIAWFQKDIHELQAYSVISLKAWINNARTIVRLYHKEAKASFQESDIDSSLHSTNHSTRRSYQQRNYRQRRKGRGKTVNSIGTTG